VGSFLVGVGSVGPTSVLQAVGTVYLAQTNVITASSGNGASDSALVALDIGDAGDAENLAGYGDSMGSALYLGQSNTISADYISVGRQWASGGIFFNPALSNPTVSIGGASAGAVAIWNIGDGAQNTLSVAGGFGTNDFTGGTVNASVNTLQIGLASPNSENTGAAVTGTLIFDAGTITANTVNISYNPAFSDGNSYSYGVGTLNVNGTGALIVNNTLNLAAAAGNVFGSPVATLNINGGSVVADYLVPGANSALSPGGTSGFTTSVINIDGGSLTVTNGVGTPAVPLTSVNLTNATITVGTAAPPYINAENVNASGVNTINLLSVPAVEVFPTTVTVLQSSNSIAGAAANFRVVGPAGYVVGAVSETNSTSIVVTLTSGPVTARGKVFWVGVAGSSDIDWSDANNWRLPPAPAAVDTAYFDNKGITDNPGGDEANNIVDTNITIAGLWYAETNIAPAYAYHNTVIENGKTLTVFNTNISIMLDSGTQSDPASAVGATTCYNTISGVSGTLALTNTNSASVMIVSQGSTTYAGSKGSDDLYATLDMSGLGTFEATVGRLLVGVSGAGAIPGEVTLVNSGRQTGILTLARTNVINLTQLGNIQGAVASATNGPALVINDNPNGFGDFGSVLYLGQSNAIYADTITVGRIQCSRTAVFEFNPNFTPPSHLYLRGASSNRVSELVIADNTQNPNNGNAAPGSGIVVPAGGFNVGSAGVVDVSAGSSDMMIDTLIVGKGYDAANGGYSAGLFNMGTGTLNVNTLLLGVLSSASANRPVTGTLSIPVGGAVVVNNQLALGQAVGGGTSAFAYGTLTVSGSLSAGTIVSGGVSSIEVLGGTMSLTSPAGSIGATTAAIGAITLNDSTLNLAVGGLGAPVVATNLTASGASNLVNVTELPALASVPATITLIQSLKRLGGYNFVLGTLPAGYTGNLQESADSTAVQLVVTAAPTFPTTPATITAVSFQPALGGVLITGTGASGLANSEYFVLTSTNLSLPLADWKVAGAGSFDASGNFSVSISYSAADVSRFYVIKSQ
jgi:hypothetical protein